MKNVLLYGAGTQSTGLLLMMLDGKIDIKLDMVIFSDTISEPDFVMDYLWRVVEYVLDKYGCLIKIVGKDGPGLADAILLNRGERIASLPLFTGNGGMIRRQCTAEYKIAPMNKHLKEEFNIKRKKRGSEPVINRMFGISLDEIERCKQSIDWWAINTYPLVQARMYRHEVINYINNNHPELKNPPRSSCYFCPFHSDNYWRALKKKHPSEFAKAILIDEAIRVNNTMIEKRYLHRSCKPLKDIDFTKTQLEIFGECEGYCGI